MAQITSSTASVTATNSLVWENRPVNPQKVIQAYKIDDFRLNSGDITGYPAIKFVVDYGFDKTDNKLPTDDNCIYWAYASGDSATRDLDFVDVNDKIGETGGGGGGTDPIEVKFEPFALDAAGNLPVSQRIITGNFLQNNDDLPLLFDRVGTGTQTYVDGHVNLNVGVGEYVLCQSKSFAPYLAGKPTTVNLTFFGMSHVVGLEQMTGFGSRETSAPYTADFDGFYFGSDGSQYVIFVRNSATGAQITIPQASWDDPLDGTGASGETANFNNFTVLVFDFLFLGGTGLRAYINIGGKKILFNTFKWSNSNTDTIFRSPNQPVFYEVRSTTGSGGFSQVCASTEVQGSIELVGVNRSVNNAGIHINANNPNLTYLLKAVRLKSTHRDCFAQINGFTTLALTNDNFLYSVVLNPIIAGAALAWNSVPDSCIEHASGDNAGANTITGGFILNSGYSNANASFRGQFRSLIRLGSTTAGVFDVFALCAQPLTNNLDILGSLDTIEL